VFECVQSFEPAKSYTKNRFLAQKKHQRLLLFTAGAGALKLEN
jgi:hypothetical protein